MSKSFGFNTYNPVYNNSGIKYAQNFSANGLSNTVNYNPNYISDDELYKRMWNNIKEFEQVIPYPYLDTKGYITTGGGANVNNLNDFMKVNFTVNGLSATDAQKQIAYNELRRLSEEKDISGNYVNRNRAAQSFENDIGVR